MGIDIQGIAKIESLPREHFCPVCQLLINPNEALQSMCGHLYCSPCLTYVANTIWACPYDGYLVTETDAKPLVESNKVLADTIGKTLVYCLYQNSGCTWAGSLADCSFHCSGCAFGDSHGMCSWCGVNIAHRQWREHRKVCLDAYNQASVAMATFQASSQSQGGVAAATLSQGQWYQQPYQQYYQNMQQQPYQPYYQNMQQQPMQLQSITAQHQLIIYVQVSPSVQTHCEMQPQPQLQSQSQSNHPHAYWPGQIPKPLLSVPPLSQHPSHRTNQVGAPPNNMFVYHHDHFPEQVSHVCSPQSLSALPSQITRDHYTKQTVLKAPVPKSLDMHSSQQHRSVSTSDTVHNQIHKEGPSYHPHHIALQEHQHMTPILGVQPHMNHFSVTPPQVGLGHAAPSLSAVMEDNGIKNESLGRQVLEEHVGNGLGKSLLVEEKCIKDDPSLNGSPLMDGLQGLRDSQFNLKIAEKYRARLEGLLVSPHVKHELELELRHVSRSSQPSINLGEGQFRCGPRGIISEHFGIPSHGYGPLDHGLRSRRVETTDSEGRYNFGLQGSNFEGVGNLQMGEKVRYADMIGPSDSNGLRLGDAGSHSRYTVQGYPGDGGSFPVKILGDWATKHVGSSNFYSQTKEHQQKFMSMDMISMINQNEKEHQITPVGSPQFGNQNKNEETRLKGS